VSKQVPQREGPTAAESRLPGEGCVLMETAQPGEDLTALRKEGGRLQVPGHTLVPC